MIDVATLISELKEKDVRMWVERDQLKISAPEGVLDPETRTMLANQKKEVVAFLQRAELLRSSRNTIVPIKPGGRNPPIFVVSGFGGDVYYFVGMARYLDADQPLLSVQPPGLDGGEPLKSVEDLARFQIEQIRAYWPIGPYLIAGHCSGGAIAFEVAQQLIAAGQEVSLLALIGSPFPTWFKYFPQLLCRLRGHASGLLYGSLEQRLSYIKGKLGRRLNGKDSRISPSRARVESATMDAVRKYKPKYYEGQLDLFVTLDEFGQSHQWHPFAKTVREHDFTRFGREELLLGPNGLVLAASFNQILETLTP